MHIPTSKPYWPYRSGKCNNLATRKTRVGDRACNPSAQIQLFIKLKQV
jgi:hypothetical protein